jgi:hypothetical protein
MNLNMRNNGKVFSKYYRSTQLRASISATRADDEERAWTDVTKTDGQRIDPDMFRQVIDPPGSKFVTGIVIDARKSSFYRTDGSVNQK